MKMSGYTKLFGSIVASTIWREPHAVRIVWITMLAIKNKDGAVEASLPGLADLARVTIDECKAALDCLMSPDEYSRTKDFEGRRVEVIEGGWYVLNHEKYRNLMSKDERKEYLRIKQQESRARRQQSVNNVNECQPPSTRSTHTDTDTDKQKKKKEHTPSERGVKFANWFKDQLPEGIKLVQSWEKEWSKCFDDMVRLDNRTPEEIFAVCKWAREDTRFWAKNFLSATKLRKSDPNGVQYFDVLAANMASARAAAEPLAPPVKQKTRHDFIKAWETKHNHDYLNYPHDEHNKPIPAYILGEADYKAYLAEQNGQ